MTLRAFEKQFRNLYLPLGMYALRLVNDIDQAEDLVQEAFIVVEGVGKRTRHLRLPQLDISLRAQ